MILAVEAGRARLALQTRNENEGFAPLTWFDVMVPDIEEALPQSAASTSDLIRSYLWNTLRHVLTYGLDNSCWQQFRPGVYRLDYADESVVDRWDGARLVGCDGDHAVNCGLFACPRPRHLCVTSSVNAM